VDSDVGGGGPGFSHVGSYPDDRRIEMPSVRCPIFLLPPVKPSNYPPGQLLFDSNTQRQTHAEAHRYQ